MSPMVSGVLATCMVTKSADGHQLVEVDELDVHLAARSAETKGS